MRMAHHCREIPLAVNDAFCCIAFHRSVIHLGLAHGATSEAFNEDRLLRLGESREARSPTAICTRVSSAIDDVLRRRSTTLHRRRRRRRWIVDVRRRIELDSTGRTTASLGRDSWRRCRHGGSRRGDKSSTSTIELARTHRSQSPHSLCGSRLSRGRRLRNDEAFDQRRYKLLVMYSSLAPEECALEHWRTSCNNVMPSSP